MKKLLFVIVLHMCLAFNCQQLLSQTCGTRQLDPRVASFLKMIGYQDMTIEQLRNLPIALIKYPSLPLIPYPKEDVQRIKITADSIPVLIFNATHGQNLPIIINYHGGGFISPLVPGLEHSLWQDSKTYGAIVFAVDYRVAPENKFPASVNDSYNAFKWISEHGSKFGGDTSRIALLGISAGANLAAVVTQKAKKEGIVSRIKLQILNGLPGDCSPTNMETSASYQENAKGYWQTKAASYFAVELYAPGQYKNPEVSPIVTDDFEGLPPAVIITAEFDPLRDDGLFYAAKLRKFGVKVWGKCFAGQIHMLLGLPPDAKEIKEYEALVKNAMKESFSK
ncbi:MAG: alpha/beta hydrolase [Ferruginibacter sp.]|uniref:alpha/beta hydrolase n=1 Tax=Ferruginibacter sp. TaxID=1940288 RepID=UPI00265AE5FE|nr:alpha/beta hydrolase [Ferruginibacter sp.]MDB5278579.1 alpha/beta hydrolase [Ferruginibacter sp.]